MHRDIPFSQFFFPKSFKKRLEEAQRDRFEGIVEKLEKKFCEKFSHEYALSTCSSTAALHLSMCALDLKRGDKVICSVNAFVDIPEVVRHFDAEPIFVDCDRRSYNIDPDMLEAALAKHKAKKLRAVIVNHMAGLPVDMERVVELAKKYNIAVIEDCTDSPYREMTTKADKSEMKIYSFGSKTDNRYDGGMLVSSRKELHERAALLRNHAKFDIAGELNYLYDVVDIGCQYRMSEYGAVYALAELDGESEDIRRRKEIADIYFDELRGLKHISLPIESKSHSYKFFIVEVDKNRDAFSRALKKQGIETSLHYIPIHSLKYYKEKYSLKIFDYPNAMSAYQSVMTLPNTPNLSDEDVVRICRSIRQIDKTHI